jgi:hypothetical protein
VASVEKISISLAAADLAWAKERAKTQDKSLSSVLSEALRRERQAEARLRLLSDLGTDDITERDRQEVRSEWRAPEVAVPKRSFVKKTKNTKRKTKG